jgi:SAM-dependent methyltransferase
VIDLATVAFESSRTRDERRRGGIFNTPLDVASAACEALIDRPGVVLDPSCGTGTFLVAARDRLRALGCTSVSLIGIDVDPAAIEVARARVPEARFIVGDGLAWTERVDFVVGNPPYVDGLQARFVAMACGVADAVAMVVPTSLLATNEGRAFRSSGLGVSSMTPLGRVFDASVDTCTLVLRRGAPVPDGPTWASLLVSSDVPDVVLTGSPLGESCDVVAGFRQHYYGLRGCVADGGSSPLRLVTSGSIDVGALNDRAVRFDGVRYASPRVSLDGSPVRDWFESLLRPKVVVATQTRVIEAAVDVDGTVVPSVPVISVLPRDPCGDVDVWRVLAVVLAPPVTAWALRRWGGTALSRSALKLGAPNVREIPWPEGDVAIAAGMLRAGDVDGAALEMCRAYGVGEVVYEWWAARIRPR